MPITLESIKYKTLDHKFGKLTVLSYVGKNERGDNIWKAKCDCGEIVIGRTSIVTQPKAACSICKRQAGSKAEERRTYLLGRTFGRLTVKEFAGTNQHQQGLWKCLCTCGNEIVTRSGSLLSGASKSCGCYARERAVETHTRHGLYDHPLYQIWYAMKDRCYNPNNPFYHRYGGRPDGKGIRVCDDWIENFLNFYNWAMGHGYHEGLSLERTHNDGNYEPGNCKWATQAEQMQNTSGTKLDVGTVRNIYKDPRTNSVIAKEFGVNESTISRIKAHATWSNVTRGRRF